MLNEIDLSRTDLNLLVLFEAVLEERHVGRAAKRMNLSASAVSHGLGRLRRMLNDPIFLRTPRGVVPTARGLELAEAIGDILRQARAVLATAAPFDPPTSRRRFMIGAPDGVSTVILSPLLESLRTYGPGIDLGVRQLLPTTGRIATTEVWEPAFADLDAHELDIAIIPITDMPARFHRQPVFTDEFVIVARKGHRFAEEPTLARYCEFNHIQVSMSSNPSAIVDDILKGKGLSRRIALTLPTFLFALQIVEESDLLCAMPRRFAQIYVSRFDIDAVECPFPMPTFILNAVALSSAMTDPGIAWLANLLPREL